MIINHRDEVQNRTRQNLRLSSVLSICRHRIHSCRQTSNYDKWTMAFIQTTKWTCMNTYTAVTWLLAKQTMSDRAGQDKLLNVNYFSSSIFSYWQRQTRRQQTKSFDDDDDDDDDDDERHVNSLKQINDCSMFIVSYGNVMCLSHVLVNLFQYDEFELSVDDLLLPRVIKHIRTHCILQYVSIKENMSSLVFVRQRSSWDLILSLHFFFERKKKKKTDKFMIRLLNISVIRRWSDIDRHREREREKAEKDVVFRLMDDVYVKITASALKWNGTLVVLPHVLLINRGLSTLHQRTSNEDQGLRNSDWSERTSIIFKAIEAEEEEEEATNRIRSKPEGMHALFFLHICSLTYECTCFWSNQNSFKWKTM
jgi:hypothetical protein